MPDPTKPTLSVDGTRVSVTIGRQVFSPIQFHTFEVGPFSMTRDLRDGETAEEALRTIYLELRAFADGVYERERTAFIERMRTARRSAQG